jgi:hypothetical protein
MVVEEKSIIEGLQAKENREDFSLGNPTGSLYQ